MPNAESYGISAQKSLVQLAQIILQRKATKNARSAKLIKAVECQGLCVIPLIRVLA
jgi:hypothetical protein